MAEYTFEYLEYLRLIPICYTEKVDKGEFFDWIKTSKHSPKERFLLIITWYLFHKVPFGLPDVLELKKEICCG